MFGFKKKFRDKALAAALLKGIAEGRVQIEQNKAQKTRNEIDLKKAYNKASGVISGLSSLQDLPGSTFEVVEIAEKEGRVYSDNVYLSIKTNIPAASDKGAITVDVDPSGYMRICGDTHSYLYANGMQWRRDYSDVKLEPIEFRATKRVLAYIGKEAAKRGMIP